MTLERMETAAARSGPAPRIQGLRRQASIERERAARAWTMPATRRSAGRGSLALRRFGFGSTTVSNAA